MTYEEYLAAVAATRVATITGVLKIAAPVQDAALTAKGFKKLAQTIFDFVWPQRWEASGHARDFYDAERDRAGLDEKDAWLANYTPEQFSSALVPHKTRLMLPGTKDNDIAALALDMAREVDMGARYTLLESVDNDDQAYYARVEGGGDGSCAWCTMLISRGPVYHSSESAGGASGAAFHRADNCVIVPVYDPDGDWPGKASYEEAERLYREASRKDGDTLANLREAVGK